MKRWLLGIAATAAVAMLAIGNTQGGPKKGEKVTVRVLSAKVMAKPKFIGKTVTKVSRGDHLVFQSTKAGWYEVSTSSGTGWIHKSAVVDKEINLSSNLKSGSASASDEEIELAGRGFTKQIEDDYRRRNGDLDFSHVDRIEALAVDSETVGQFAAAGKVGGMQ